MAAPPPTSDDARSSLRAPPFGTALPRALDGEFRRSDDDDDAVNVALLLRSIVESTSRSSSSSLPAVIPIRVQLEIDRRDRRRTRRGIAGGSSSSSAAAAAAAAADDDDDDDDDDAGGPPPANTTIRTYFPPLSRVGAGKDVIVVSDFVRYVVEEIFVNDREGHFSFLSSSSGSRRSRDEEFASTLLGDDDDECGGGDGGVLPDATFRYGGGEVRRIPRPDRHVDDDDDDDIGIGAASASSLLVDFSLMEGTGNGAVDLSPSANARGMFTKLLSSSSRGVLDLTLRANVAVFRPQSFPLLTTTTTTTTTTTATKRKMANEDWVDDDGARADDGRRAKRGRNHDDADSARAHEHTSESNGIPPALDRAWRDQIMADRSTAARGRAMESEDDGLELPEERERRPIAASKDVEGDDVNVVDDEGMIDDADSMEGGGGVDRIVGMSARDAEPPMKGESRVDESADDDLESSSSVVLLSQGNAKTNADDGDGEDEEAIGTGKIGNVANGESRKDADRSGVSLSTITSTAKIAKSKLDESASSSASKDGSILESSSDDSSSSSSSDNDDSEDEGPAVAPTKAHEQSSDILIPPRQSQDNDAHDHPTSLHLEHEVGTVDDEIINDVDESNGACGISQPSPDDAETSTKNDSKDNQSSDDDSSSSSSRSKMVEPEEEKKIENLHSDDNDSSSNDEDGSMTAGGEGDDEEVTNKGINVHETNIAPGGSVVSSSATNANTSDDKRAKLVGQKQAEEGASSAPSKDSSSSESSTDNSSGDTDSSSSSSSEDSGDEGSIVEGTNILKGGTGTIVSTQHSQIVRDCPTSQFMSGKATPHASIANSDQIFTQESAIVPTNLFGKMDHRYGDNQHVRGGEIESATPPNEEGKSKEAGSAKRWDSDSSFSSSSSSDSEESNGGESDEEREIPSKDEQLANSSEMYDDKNLQLCPMTPASYQSDGSSESSSSSEDDNRDGGNGDEEKKKFNHAATSITNNKGGSSSSSSDTSSSSVSSSDSDSESSSSSSEDKRREAEAVQQKTPVSTNILPVVRSSRGRRRTPLVSMNRKIIINTSRGVPKTESFAR